MHTPSLKSAAAATATLMILTSCHSTPAPNKPAVPTTGMAPVNGIELYYEIHGAGEPLILLHGGLGHTGHWRNQIPLLSEHYRVIAMDSRGHGRSTLDDTPIDYALMASDVVGLMDSLEVETANIVGWSDGGNTGLFLAIHHPERVTALVACGANSSPAGMRPGVEQTPKIAQYVEKAARDYLALSPNPDGWDAFLENIGRTWATEPSFTAEQLGGVTVPTLILTGQDEEAIDPEHTREMAAMIPTARLEVLAGTGHFAMWEKPDESNRAILEFLAR